MYYLLQHTYVCILLITRPAVSFKKKLETKRENVFYSTFFCSVFCDDGVSTDKCNITCCSIYLLEEIETSREENVALTVSATFRK